MLRERKAQETTVDAVIAGTAEGTAISVNPETPGDSAIRGSPGKPEDDVVGTRTTRATRAMRQAGQLFAILPSALFPLTLWAMLGVGGAACSDGGNTPTSGELPSSADGRLKGAACPFTETSGHKVLCGVFTAPENRSAPNGRSVRLEVAIVKGRGAGADRSPVLYLEGGPGGNAISNVMDGLKAFEPILAEHDLVVFDHRGAGFSTPSLDCTENVEVPADATKDEAQQAWLEAYGRCGQRLSQSADLSQYNTQSIAADAIELRNVLGYASWSVFGVSYGTRVALEMLRQDSNGIASVVLDSTLPGSVDWIASMAPNMQRSLFRLFTTCAASSSCASAYPSLQDGFFALLSSLDTKPLTLKLDSGEKVAIDGDSMLTLFSWLLYWEDWLGYIPLLIQELRTGQYDHFTKVASALIASRTGAISIGLYYAVVCAEDAANSSVDKVKEANLGANTDARIMRVLGGTDIFDICKTLQIPAASADVRQPVASDVSTLVLSGEYDPVTPPMWADLVAQTLTSSSRFDLAGGTHGVFVDRCGSDAVVAFLRDPHGHPVSSCTWYGQDLDFAVAGHSPQSRQIATYRFGKGVVPGLGGRLVKPVRNSP